MKLLNAWRRCGKHTFFLLGFQLTTSVLEASRPWATLAPTGHSMPPASYALTEEGPLYKTLNYTMRTPGKHMDQQLKQYAPYINYRRLCFCHAICGVEDRLSPAQPKKTVRSCTHRAHLPPQGAPESSYGPSWSCTANCCWSRGGDNTQRPTASSRGNQSSHWKRKKRIY